MRVFKVCRVIGDAENPIFVSSWAKGTSSLTYEVDTLYKQELAPMFAFTSYTEAKEFCSYDEVIFECEAEHTKLPDANTIILGRCDTINDRRLMENFWNDRYYSEDVTDRVLKDTIFCYDLKLSRVVYAGSGLLDDEYGRYRLPNYEGNIYESDSV